MGLMSVHLIFILFYCNVLHHIFDPSVTALHLIEQPTYKAQYIIELMTSLSVQCTQFFYAGIIAGPRYAAGYSIEHRWLVEYANCLQLRHRRAPIKNRESGSTIKSLIVSVLIVFCAAFYLKLGSQQKELYSSIELTVFAQYLVLTGWWCCDYAQRASWLNCSSCLLPPSILFTTIFFGSAQLKVIEEGK